MRTRLTALALVLGAACSGNKSPSTTLTRDQLLDPKTCASCHVDHYSDWASSMHAYASDDPVFRAMNARGQRETDGGLGNFCVNCHAPQAVREGATVDGLNLDSVDPKLKGVGCFFCHSVDQVTGAHDDPLHLATDGVMRASYSDSIASTPHGAGAFPLQDRNQLASATLCGACHDIVSPHGAAIERTFSEWQHSAFSGSPAGTTCGQCHMAQSAALRPIAAVEGAPARHFHAHSFEAVDLSLAADGGTGAAQQRQLVQTFLDTTLQSALCVRSLAGQSQVEVILDNVASGHGFPSGAAQDRRFWAEVHAYADGGELLASGAVPDGGEVTSLSDAWLLRDCMYDASGAQVTQFWDAATSEGNELPAQATFDATSPAYYQSHILQTYPLVGGTLATAPDRATVTLHLQPIGADVLRELVTTGDLDAEIPLRMPTLDVGSALEWTPTTATTTFVETATGAVVSCISTTGLNVQAATVPAPKNAHCTP